METISIFRESFLEEGFESRRYLDQLPVMVSSQPLFMEISTDFLALEKEFHFFFQYVLVIRFSQCNIHPNQIIKLIDKQYLKTPFFGVPKMTKYQTACINLSNCLVLYFKSCILSRNKTYSEEIVLERAMNTFWSNGYEATSIRMLEKEMGINQFSIYASFQNKKNLFIHSIQHYLEHAKRERFRELLKEGAGVADLEKFLYTSVERNRLKPGYKGCLVVNTAGEIGSRDPDIAKEVNQYYDFVRSLLEKVISHAVDKNEIAEDTDVQQQANFFLGVMQGISVASKTMDRIQLHDLVKVALAQLK